ncbi:hypothetical protein [Amycolatopsis sp. NPDC004625]|uniref:hypothetical protein n=1 Tax=Amycolatopsis sp. NPDC004625 TaxID=3154670 RepID=UPI0033B56981
MTGTVGAVVADLSPVVAPVVRSVGPLAEPVSQIVRSVEPLAQVVAPIAKSVLDPVVQAVEPVTRPVAGVVQPVTAPVLGAPPPARTSRLPLVVSRAVGPVLAPVSPVVVGLAVDEPVSAAHPAARPQAESAHPVRPGRVCTGEAAPHRSTVHADLRPRRDAPGDTPVPVRPAPSDVASGTGSTIPPAFLATGHGIHVLPAATRVHGVFVPLWRPCEPGTGPG